MPYRQSADSTRAIVTRMLAARTPVAIFVGPSGRLWLDTDESLTGSTEREVLGRAQSLPDELLEEIRLLANIEAANAKLLQVLLVGQPELAARLNQPALRQLKQRIAVRGNLAPLDARDVSALIAGRIRVAWGEPLPPPEPPAPVRMVVRRLFGFAADNPTRYWFMETKPGWAMVSTRS